MYDDSQKQPHLIGRKRWQERRVQWVASLPSLIHCSAVTPRGQVTMELTEKRSLGTDGRTLILDVSRDTPRGTRSRRLVFDRQS